MNKNIIIAVYQPHKLLQIILVGYQIIDDLLLICPKNRGSYHTKGTSE